MIHRGDGKRDSDDERGDEDRRCSGFVTRFGRPREVCLGIAEIGGGVLPAFLRFVFLVKCFLVFRLWS
jgi:hypothetical protein